MKITAPISSLDELEGVAKTGADEIYCGCVPDDWSKRFGAAAPSRRQFGNLRSLGDLAEAIAIAQRLGKSLSLALNQQHYSGAQLDAAIDLAERFAGLGGDAVIAADPGLIAALGAALPNLKLHVSSIATVRNSAAARFFQDLGATRIVLPRFTTLREMRRLRAAVPELEFEAFVLNDGCLFDEGVCHTLHLPGALGGPICMDSRSRQYLRSDGTHTSARDRQRLQENEAEYRRWAWHKFSCGFSVTEDGLPYGPCGLCAIPELAAAGITAIKIAGREFPSQRKLKSVHMVKEVLARSARPDDARSFARGLRHRPDYCRDGFMCYYPEVVDEGAAETLEP